jgi:hypothetical protein
MVVSMFNLFFMTYGSRASSSSSDIVSTHSRRGRGGRTNLKMYILVVSGHSFLMYRNFIIDT